MDRQAVDGGAPVLPDGVTVVQLRAAVAASRSWRGVLREVGLTSPRQGRKLKQACDEYGIDYRHFRNRRADDADVALAVAGSTSWAQLLARLGHAPDSGSARASVRAHSARLGFDLDHLGALPGPSPADPLSDAPDPRHLRAAGSMLVAAALTLSGHRVSWPLEPTVYDLLVDVRDRRVCRVQVKTTTVAVDGAWLCKLTHSTYAACAGGKRTTHYDPDDVDYFGIGDGDQSVYLVPMSAVAGLSAISMRKYQAYLVPDLRAGPSSTAARPSCGCAMSG